MKYSHVWMSLMINVKKPLNFRGFARIIFRKLNGYIYNLANMKSDWRDIGILMEKLSRHLVNP